MTIKGVLLRFFLIYSVLLILAGLVMGHFGIKGSSGVNIGILAGCVMWVCGAFGKKNRRYFSRNEKTMVVLGILAIDLLLQFIFAAAALAQSSLEMKAGALLVAVAFIGVLHAIAIYFFVGFARRPLVKQGIISD